MLASVRALLDGIIDYAGLFPPAQLALPQAVRHYADYLAGPDAWMLGRFVCPVGQVVEALRLLPETNPPPRFSVLPRTDANGAEFLRKLREDVLLLPGYAWDVWELRLPTDVGNPGAFLRAADEVLAARGANMIFCEAAAGAGTTTTSLLKQLQEYSERGKGARVGFKLRTGGTEAAAFPPPEQIADVVIACRETGLPLKFTAGLHHPMRRFDAGVGTHMYGIINVFAAALLAHAQPLDAGILRQILLEEDPSHFTFTETEFGWGEQCIDVETVRDLRSNKVISFGSCSFDEPRDDLRTLGLLPPAR